ncbi:MAG TPA: ATP-binding cassette domain-containing protein [Gaiellaceae bacterium]|nr:ATP-binding cassette domain-containing protein [Gaiellaceae bacterium]
MADRTGIVCRAVSRVYRSPSGSVEALHALNLSLRPGALHALVGPSGCGKSSLLRLLAGLDAPDAGSIMVGGIDVESLRGSEVRRFRRETVSYLAQRPAANLIPHLTLREHLEGSAARLAVAEEIGIAHRLDARAGEMSGGEQARAAIAIGIARETSFVLVDEPTAELDRRTATRVIDALARATADGRTVVVATHDPDVIRVAAQTVELATRVAEHPRFERRARETRAPAIVLDRVSKSYGPATVVDEVSLELQPGELGVLVGRSGSGKSTALMLAGGWLSPDSGVARVPGGSASAPPAWARTSYLSQRFGLLPELSVAENIALPLRLTGADQGGRVAELMDALSLTDLGERLPAETSVGQQQRAALARALVQHPEALIADEPTSHQDARSAELVWSALVAACERGTACLIATHEERAPFADRVWRISDGRIQEP